MKQTAMQTTEVNVPPTLTHCKTPPGMASYRRMFQFLLGFVGCTLLVMLFFYQKDMSQRTLETIHQRQKMRKQLLKEVCDRNKTFDEGMRSFDDLGRTDLKHLVVDDKHGVIYCFVPKVACTNWKRVMFVLHNAEPYRDPLSFSSRTAHTHKNLTFLVRSPRTEIKVKLKHYTKFLFVRDPFVRLISAYRDKLQKARSFFYSTYSRSILQQFGNQPNPPKKWSDALALGVHPSFRNFIQFLTDPKTSAWAGTEHHWKPMYHICHPCAIDYDFIGHQETLHEDAEQLLKLLKLEKNIRFPPANINVTAPDSEMDWFSTVPLKDRRALYKLYEADFRLFGYRRPDELLDD